MWQFQVLAQGGRLGIWNQKTRLVSVSDFLLSKTKSSANDPSVQWIEDNQLRIHRTHGKYEMFLVIEFDHVDASAL